MSHGQVIQGGPHGPKQLVQVALKEGDSIQMQLLEALQPEELRDEPGDEMPPLLWGDKVIFMDAGEGELVQVPHVAQVRSQVKQESWVAGEKKAQSFCILQAHLSESLLLQWDGD